MNVDIVKTEDPKDREKKTVPKDLNQAQNSLGIIVVVSGRRRLKKDKKFQKRGLKKEEKENGIIIREFTLPVQHQYLAWFQGLMSRRFG